MGSPLELGDWVPVALPRTSNISVRVSTRFPSCDQRLLARKYPVLSPPSRSCFPRILFTGRLMQKVTKTLQVSSFELGFPQEPKAECVYGWFQLAPHRSCVPRSGGGANHATQSGRQPSAPIPYAFWGFPATAEILVLYCGRTQCEKLGTTLSQYHWS